MPKCKISYIFFFAMTMCPLASIASFCCSSGTREDDAVDENLYSFHIDYNHTTISTPG